MTKQPTKSKRCAHCKKVFKASRSSVRYCSSRCREAAKRKESGPLKERRQKSLKIAQHPLFVLRQSKFVNDLLQQVARHGSVDCLLDFPIEDLYSLWRARGRLAFKTGTQVHIAHLVPCSKGGAYHPLNLTLLPAKLNQSHGARFSFPKGVGTHWTNQPVKPFMGNIEELWKELVEKHRTKLLQFAKKHPKISGTERARTAQRILKAPETNLVYLSTVMAMAQDSLSSLCDRLGVVEVKKLNGSATENETEKWPAVAVHMFHIQRLKQFYTAKGRKYTEQFIKAISAFPTDKLPMDIVEMACCARPVEALDTLLSYIQKNEHQLPFSYEDILMKINSDDDDLFITANLDGSKVYVHFIDTDNKSCYEPLTSTEAELYEKAYKNARIAIAQAKKTGQSPISVLEQVKPSFSAKPVLYALSMERLMGSLFSPCYA